MSVTGTASPITAVPPWHTLTPAETARRLHIDPDTGLDPAKARQRLQQYGVNDLIEGKRRGPLRMVLDQFKDLMILILIAAALIAGMLGDALDAWVILVIVALNAVAGFVQEYRTERAVAALKKMAALHAHVRRAGRVRTVNAAGLVPGDVVLLEAGNLVPADLRLIETAQLRVDESALTGESQPVEKRADVVIADAAPLGDRQNMAYRGTIVSHGRGGGLVVATGMATEIGRIAALLQTESEPKTPLQQRLTRFAQVLTLTVIVLCLIVFAAGVLRGEPMVLMFLTAVSLAVAAIPEALPTVITLTLAMGASRMAAQNALIRRLPAVETLGSVTYICTDKTGTLTLNRMRVQELYADERTLPSCDGEHAGAPWDRLFRALALSNDAEPDARGGVTGDPTEVALYEAAARAGYDKKKLLGENPRLAELPFDSQRKRMTTLHREPSQEHSQIIAYTKGAPETVLPYCQAVLSAGGIQTPAPATLGAAAQSMAARGMRVLAVAYRVWPRPPDTVTPETVETQLIFLGFVGLMDPPRPQARSAVAACRSAGITPVMITGDHPGTARAIALALDIIDGDEEVLTGPELARLPAAALAERIRRIHVYARVVPEQKIEIVQALQANGEFVAMTGDGVNDAPALRRANIGVAMGVTGTDAAKQAAHMILLDDNFATIVAAVREGRRIFDNIRKFVRFVMAGNAGEIAVILLAPFLGLPIPLLPIHILWVNLVTDGLPGLALSAEPEERGVMQRPPRPPHESLFAHGLWQHILWVGALIGVFCLLTQAWALAYYPAQAQTMVFTVLTLSQLAHVLAIRSESEGLWQRGLMSNRPLLVAVLFTFVLQMAVVYLPVMNTLFKTQPLNAAQLGFCLALSAQVFLAVELEKWLIRRRWLYIAPRRAA